MESHLSHYLDEQRNKLKKVVSSSRRAPTRKNVHDLRVSLKRLRTALWMSRESVTKIKVKKLSSTLKKTGRKFGKVRDIDILLSYRSLFPNQIQYLEERRKKFSKLAISELDSKWEKSVLSKIEKVEHEVQSEPRKLISRTRKVRKDLKHWLKTDVKPNDLHHLRMVVKKTRYFFEVLDKHRAPLKTLQDLLGQIHDLRNLEAFQGVEQASPERKSLEKQAIEIIRPVLKFALKELGDEVYYVS